MRAGRRHRRSVLRWAGIEGRLGTLTVGTLPLAILVLRALFDVGLVTRLAGSAGALAALGAAGGLTVLGMAWMWRIASPPFRARPARWRAHREVAARISAVGDGLDRAWVLATAGADLGRAVDEGFAAAPTLAQRVREAAESSPSATTGGPVPPASEEGWLRVVRQAPSGAPAAEMLGRARIRFLADWEHVVTVRAERLPREMLIPFVVCALPASVLTAVLGWP